MGNFLSKIQLFWNRIQKYNNFFGIESKKEGYFNL